MASAKELIEFVAKSIVDDPSQVRVSEIERGSTLTVELRVGQEDMGRVIGRSGRTANAMRALLRILAAKQEKRIDLEIV